MRDLLDLFAGIAGKRHDERLGVHTVPPQMAHDERRALAITAIAAELGAIVISRGILKSDPALADGVLETVRARLGDVLGA